MKPWAWTMLIFCVGMFYACLAVLIGDFLHHWRDAESDLEEES